MFSPLSRAATRVSENKGKIDREANKGEAPIDRVVAKRRFKGIFAQSKIDQRRFFSSGCCKAGSVTIEKKNILDLL